MNKKGFAVSIILYSIVLLIITILYMLLGIVKTRYTVSDNLRENITQELNQMVIRTNSMCYWQSRMYYYLSSCVDTRDTVKERIIENPSDGDSYTVCADRYVTSYCAEITVNCSSGSNENIKIGCFETKSKENYYENSQYYKSAKELLDNTWYETTNNNDTSWVPEGTCSEEGGINGYNYPIVNAIYGYDATIYTYACY